MLSSATTDPVAAAGLHTPHDPQTDRDTASRQGALSSVSLTHRRAAMSGFTQG